MVIRGKATTVAALRVTNKVENKIPILLIDRWMGLELLLLHIDVLEWINPRTATEEEMVITRFGTQ